MESKIKEKVLKELEKYYIHNKLHGIKQTKQAIDLTLAEVEKVIKEVLTNTRRKVNEEIKDEQSIAHSHTAINQIEDGLKKGLRK